MDRARGSQSREGRRPSRDVPSSRSPADAWPGLALLLRKFPTESPAQKPWSRMFRVLAQQSPGHEVGGWVSSQDTKWLQWPRSRSADERVQGENTPQGWGAQIKSKMRPE